MRALKLVLVVGLSAAVLPLIDAASLLTAFTRSLGPQEEITFSTVPSTDVSNGEFEERVYPSKQWVCTKQNGGLTEGDQIQVFLKLFAYIDGANDQNKELVMGLPVSIEYSDVEGQKVYTACFFIPEADQAAPPAPTNSQVFLTTRPQMTVLTRQFGGYANDEPTWMTEVQALTKLVNEAGYQVNPNLIYWNAYDPPYKFWGRRNEVWLLKQ
ncbi:hypothetical protein OTU49_011520 [Cherax quadricarinatus]|uniref:Heme-binding protein 1 n=1 Tax=Cherax quadricarinatus TaxID=27406 RepID=A0AAW0W3I3_CHEQU|nr:heme-binding protein 1-like [Cherax quadricarinatus]